MNAPSEPMTSPEKMRVRAAAARAPKLYPGPVGELIARELDSWAELGYRVGPGLTARLCDHVLGAALPAAGVPA